MKLTLDITFPKAEVEVALESIFSLEPDIRPTEWSDDDVSRRYPVTRLDDVIQRSGSSSGCSLWAPLCSYLILFERGFISASSQDHGTLLRLMSALAELPLEFGYACAYGEIKHRNRVSKEMAYGLEEAWVGRDYCRYLPGLYWLTALPVTLQQRYDIPTDAIKSVSKEAKLVANRNWLIRLYDMPDMWDQESARVDRWCASTKGCFSKKLVLKSLANVRTFNELSAALSSWP